MNYKKVEIKWKWINTNKSENENEKMKMKMRKQKWDTWEYPFRLLSKLCMSLQWKMKIKK